MKQKRLKRSKKLLNNIKNYGNQIIYSRKKSFTIDPVVNKQNDRVVSFGQDVPEMPNVSTTKHPTFVMMLGVVSSNKEKMPTLWFPMSYRLTARDYKNIFKSKVLPWIRRVVKKADYGFQQDVHQPPTTEIVHVWLQENFQFWSKDIWFTIARFEPVGLQHLNACCEKCPLALA